MEYLYLPKPGDREIISEEIAKYEQFSNDQLAAAIKREAGRRSRQSSANAYTDCA